MNNIFKINNISLSKENIKNKLKKTYIVSLKDNVYKLLENNTSKSTNNTIKVNLFDLSIIFNKIDTYNYLFNYDKNLIESINNKIYFMALLFACNNGYLDLVQSLIKKGINVNDSNNEGDTALIIASKNGYLNIVKELIDKGAYVRTSNKKGITSLIYACDTGYSDIIKELIDKGAKIDIQSTLIYGIKNKKIKIVDTLIKEGKEGLIKDINMILLDKDNKTKDYKYTALMLACYYGNLNIVKLLIEKGADITTKNNLDLTPLMYSAYNKQYEIIEFLILKFIQDDQNKNLNDKYIVEISNLSYTHDSFYNYLKKLEEELNKSHKLYNFIFNRANLLKSFTVSKNLTYNPNILNILEYTSSSSNINKKYTNYFIKNPKDETIKKYFMDFTYFDELQSKNEEKNKNKEKNKYIERGKELYKNWIEKKGIIDKIEKLYIKYYDLEKENYNATLFNDLYKWMTLPVIKKLQKQKGDIIVTFQLNISDTKIKTDLKDNKDNIREKIIESFKTLKLRKFNKDKFTLIMKRSGVITLIMKQSGVITKNCNTGRITEEDINSICFINGNSGIERSLVDGDIYDNEETYLEKLIEDMNKVNIGCFQKEKNYIIEVTGPWHKVTWVETSLMQCFYQTIFLHYNNINDDNPYIKYITEALKRCAISVAYTHSIQDEQNEVSQYPIKCALFTGRRTNSLLFLLLQNLFFTDNFNQNDNSTKHRICLGTSSCDSKLILDKELGEGHCLNLIGDYSHEISMVISILYPELDADFIPFSQILGHYLYKKIVLKKDSKKMQMFPDTLGTRNFLHAANLIDIGKGNKKESFLKKINSVRQDFGSLSDFIKNLIDYNYITDDNVGNKLNEKKFKEKYDLMVSEIDDPKKLKEAADLCYSSFGADGFFGDTIKIWGNKDILSYEMSIKVVRVSYKTDNRNNFNKYNYFKKNYSTSDDKSMVIGFPIKIGDPKDRVKGIDFKTHKISYNRKLDQNKINIIEKYIQKVINSDYKLNNNLNSSSFIPLQNSTNKKKLKSIDNIITYISNNKNKYIISESDKLLQTEYNKKFNIIVKDIFSKNSKNNNSNINSEE